MVPPRFRWRAYVVEHGSQVTIGTCLGRTQEEALRDVRRRLGSTLHSQVIHVVRMEAST